MSVPNVLRIYCIYVFMFVLLSTVHRHFQKSFCIGSLKLVLPLSMKVENEVKQEIRSTPSENDSSKAKEFAMAHALNMQSKRERGVGKIGRSETGTAPIQEHNIIISK